MEMFYNFLPNSEGHTNEKVRLIGTGPPARVLEGVAAYGLCLYLALSVTFG